MEGGRDKWWVVGVEGSEGREKLTKSSVAAAEKIWRMERRSK